MELLAGALMRLDEFLALHSVAGVARTVSVLCVVGWLLFGLRWQGFRCSCQSTGWSLWLCCNREKAPRSTSRSSVCDMATVSSRSLVCHFSCNCSATLNNVVVFLVGGEHLVRVQHRGNVGGGGGIANAKGILRDISHVQVAFISLHWLGKCFASFARFSADWRTRQEVARLSCELIRALMDLPKRQDYIGFARCSTCHPHGWLDTLNPIGHISNRAGHLKQAWRFWDRNGHFQSKTSVFHITLDFLGKSE